MVRAARVGAGHQTGRPAMTPDEALRRIAFLLEWRGASPYRVRAFHTAADAARALEPGPVDAARAGRLRGVGPVTAEVIAQASTGSVPRYLARLEAEAGPEARAGWDLAAASTGDCHLHSDWSDGGSPLEDMAEAARALGHQWAVLTDHSPRLTIAHGLSPDRLRSQLRAVAAVNAGLGPGFRLLSFYRVRHPRRRLPRPGRRPARPSRRFRGVRALQAPLFFLGR
ncbi:PHP domain-containing protein [Streptomyces sp. C]|nr:PHP domain-containing protein [Streptomyces sp. C]